MEIDPLVRALYYLCLNHIPSRDLCAWPQINRIIVNPKLKKKVMNELLNLARAFEEIKKRGAR